MSLSPHSVFHKWNVDQYNKMNTTSDYTNTRDQR